MATIASLPPPRRGWPDRATLWRWHFYAGFLCIPFVLWLAFTGSIYVWRPQIEALLDRPYARVAEAGTARHSLGEIAGAAVGAVPGSVLHRLQLPNTETQAVQVLVGQGRDETRVYVNPATLAVVYRVDEDQRPMRIVFRLHGELLAGAWGSYLVELAASWAIVMIVTGLALWWPRGRAGLAGLLWPRLGLRGRPLWRDLHASVGLWVSVIALLFLLSGLPWAKSWGGYLKAARGIAAGAAVSQDWGTSHAQDVALRAARDEGTREMLDEHAEHQGMIMAHPRVSYAPLDPIARTLRPLGLAAPVLIAPPAGIGQPWTAKSDAADRPRRVDLTFDPSGRLRTRLEFADRPLLDQVVGTGVAAHEGQLFGLANQLLNLAVAVGLALLAVSGVVMWWRRKPADVLGAPPVAGRWAPGVAFVALLIGLGLMLPLLGLSMLIVLLVERAILQRLPGPRRWLGLNSA